uniref:RRM domain-containing protein n=1 Tax=Heterorhabditis bacteriophora TaxID=37862 RepID=A0A1I7WN99_HETBA
MSIRNKKHLSAMQVISMEMMLSSSHLKNYLVVVFCSFISSENIHRELTAAMSRLELETKDADLCRQHFDDLAWNSPSSIAVVNRWWSKCEQLQLNKNHPINFNETAHDVITSPVPSPVDNLFPSRRPRTAYVWNGELPPRNYSNPMFSCKIFVGGVPWDITEPALLDAFAPYGNCRVEWPGKEARYSRSHARHVPRGKVVTGYVYMIFDMERSVKALLQDCSQEFGSAGEWYFKLKARRNQTTEIRQVLVQIIPWVVSDASYVEDPGCRLDPKKTVIFFCNMLIPNTHVTHSRFARHIVGGPYEDHRPLMRNAPRVPSAAEENETYLAEQHMAYGAHSAQHHNYVGCAMRRYGNGPSMMYHVGVRGGYPSRQSFY